MGNLKQDSDSVTRLKVGLGTQVCHWGDDRNWPQSIALGHSWLICRSNRWKSWCWSLVLICSNHVVVWFGLVFLLFQKNLSRLIFALLLFRLLPMHMPLDYFAELYKGLGATASDFWLWNLNFKLLLTLLVHLWVLLGPWPPRQTVVDEVHSGSHWSARSKLCAFPHSPFSRIHGMCEKRYWMFERRL